MVFISLFTSMSTMLCCGIPIIMIALGFGAALASATTTLPWLNYVGEYENWILVISALYLILVYFVIRNLNYCPTDPKQAEFCRKSKKFNWIVFWIAVAIWIIGFSASYIIYPLSIALGY